MRNKTPTPNALGVSKYLIYELSRTNLKNRLSLESMSKNQEGCPQTH